MRNKCLVILAVLSVFAAQPLTAQEQGTGNTSTGQQVSSSVGGNADGINAMADAAGIRRYQLGPGDIIELRVYNDTTLTGKYTVDDDGMIDIPLVGVIKARCQTDIEIKQEVLKGLKKYLKNPSISLSIVERKSRAQAVVFGAVRAPTRAQMNRRVRLLELLAVAGGTTEDAGTEIQIYHTEQLMCPTPEELAQAEEEKKDTNPLNMPFNVYNLEDLRLGKREANPFIRPGDIVIVINAKPIFVTGFVRQPSNLHLQPNMSLTRAIAQVGGLAPGARKDKVYIYRRQPGKLEPQILTFNLDDIRKQKAPDVALQPYDIIDVQDSSPWSKDRLLQTLTGFAMQGAQQVSSGGLFRIIY